MGRAIAEAVKPWDEPNATPPESAPGWRAFFEALNGELAHHASATGDRDRLLSLNRLHQMDLALWTVAWAPAVQVRSALEEWLAPRIRIAWAERRLLDFVETHKSDSPGSTEHSEAWNRFIGEDLASSLADYEGARTVQARSDALKRLTTVLGSLRENNQAVRWPYSTELQVALDRLYNLPNLDVSADVASVQPFLSNPVVTSGPIFRNGYVSQVTAGPRTGFGLLPSDEGIAFYNSQLATTVTPITDFQQQLQQDQKGRRVAKLYRFGAQSYDTPELTITAIIRPSTGLSLSPSYSHRIGAAFSAMPIQGKGLTRGLLSLIGLDREKLTEKVGEQATPRIAQGVVQGANQEAAERIPGVEAQQNANLRKVLVGNDTAAIRDFRITDLSFRSRPTNLLVTGRVGHETLPDVLGADMPQPSGLIVPASGVSADLHVASVLSNAVAGLLQQEEVRGVDNVMLVTKAVEPGAPAKEGLTVGKNVDFATFLKNIDEARAQNNPNVTALRIKKPAVPPEFAVDQRAFLVVLVRDFQMDVPSPPGSEKGGLLGSPSRVIRFLVPTAEFVLSYKVPEDGSGPPTKLEAKVEDFVASPGSKVQTLFDDESKPTTMGPFQANIALAGFRAKLQQVPINVPLTNVKIPGFAISQISPLDPSGWMRLVLEPDGTPIKPPQVQASAEPSATVSSNVAP
ncbi:hypothetical protein P12x_000484 [Tundrisphaera lichenicola]|uniref:hypothetical protein n=1 Tax=Tundrisphaera lichenicola TaxID=2029860 RepID=UPI003EB6D59E